MGFSLVVASGGYSWLWCTGFSSRWLLLLRSTGSRLVGFSSCGSRALERRLGICGARAWLLRGMWDLPGPGLKPMSPALAGGFLTTVPPGKAPFLFMAESYPIVYMCHIFFIHSSVDGHLGCFHVLYCVVHQCLFALYSSRSLLNVS